MNDKTILLIEDDLPLIRMYQVILEKAGFKVKNALDGEEGIKKINDDKPDLVLLDVILPKKDGFEVLKEVKSNQNTAKIPIFCLTVLHQEEDMKRCKNLGADDFLVKTDVTPDDLISKINSRLSS